MIFRTAVLLLFFIAAAIGMHAQNDSLALDGQLKKVERALLEKDSQLLKQVLHPEMHIGHSNGFVQDRKAVLRDMESGYLVYDEINSKTLGIKIYAGRAFVEQLIDVAGKINGKEFRLKLFVFQLWIKTKKGWQLLMRQSAKQA